MLRNNCVLLLIKSLGLKDSDFKKIETIDGLDIVCKGTKIIFPFDKYDVVGNLIFTIVPDAPFYVGLVDYSKINKDSALFFSYKDSYFAITAKGLSCVDSFEGRDFKIIMNFISDNLYAGFNWSIPCGRIYSCRLGIPQYIENVKGGDIRAINPTINTLKANREIISATIDYSVLGKGHFRVNVIKAEHIGLGVLEHYAKWNPECIKSERYQFIPDSKLAGSDDEFKPKPLPKAEVKKSKGKKAIDVKCMSLEDFD